MLRRIVRVAAVLPAAFTFAQDHDHQDPQQQRLGVVVPAYKGDLARAVSSLERWPAKCSPLTLENADLVLYYAEEESSGTASALDSISSTAGRCFSRTRIVYANLAEEDDIYPQGPSVMFYNMFLDEDVRSSLSEYDALSIVEWDVLVASDNSFEELYHAAFRVNEEFWVKGSNLEGTSFHSNADAIEMWQVLGHINGNAIYNNDDPAFVEYVEYTRSRWGYEHPYDVALWMTISDFPYSWPLYQRYSSKFVVTNLISSVGYEHVNHDTVSDAVAGKTLFIHGSSVDEGNVASYQATEGDASVDVAATKRHLTEDVPKWKTQEKWRNNTIPKWKSNQKWKTKKDDGVPKWRANQKWKKQYEDSPDEEGCLDGCEYTSKDGTKGRVCDSNCSRGDAYGTLGCGAKSGKYGAECRACYNDVEKARKQDTPGNRAIMCSTKMPVDVYDRRLTAEGNDPLLVAHDLEALQGDASSPSEEEDHRQLTEDVPKWKAEEKWRNNTVPKWKQNQKWKTKKDDGVPKWRANQKWKKQYEDSPDEEGCLDGCEYTSKDGTKGRVCDSNCSRGDAYGTLGCGAKSGKYGAECRACYNDVEKARKQDTPGNRAIMCSTKMPVDVYDRRLTADDESDPLLVARDLEALQEDASSPSEEEEHRQLTEDVPKWKAEEKWRNNTVPKWKQNQKWKTKKDDGVPKWRANQKWKKQYEDSPDEGCLDGCEYTSKDGTKGRVCDSNCSRGDAYGTLGCGAKSGKYGADCRACYNDVEKARKQDTPGNRAIMCSTKMPVDVYDRRLTADDESDPLLVARDLEALQEDASSPSEEEEHRQLTEDVPKWKAEEKWRNNTVPKWKQNQKWKTKKDDGVPKWRANQKWKKQYEDSPDEGCLDGCEYTSKDGTKGRVCDSNCSRGDAYGTLGCGAKSGKYGAECRACYNDVEKARKQDTPGNRAIMCSTKMPVDVYDRRLTADDESDPLLVARDLEVLQEDASSPSEEEEHRQLTEDVPKWKAEEKWRNNTVPKWKQNQKWKTKKDDGVPKWRANQKWKKQYEDSPDEEGCLDGCEYTSKDGTKGRVCDSNCSRGDAYGTLGCGAKSGKYGADCRACYNDVEKARKQDTPGNRAIMCSTKMPVDVYDRRLTADDESDPLLVARDLEALQEDASSPSEEEKHRQLTEDVPKWKAEEKWRNNTVPKWKQNQKWKTKKDDGVPKWRANQKWKKQYEDSPDEEGCLDGCEYTSKDGTKGRVCDSNCSRGDAYGTLGCGAKSGKYGAECRACYNDVEKARKQDTPGNRAIMCSTKMPVDVYGRRLTPVDESDPLLVARDLEVLQEDASSPSEEEHRQLTEDVPKWKAEEKWRNNTVPKWKQNQKWKTKKDDGIPKWRANQKWKKQYEDSPDEEGCLDGCEYTSKDGTKGRVCDSNCSRGDAYGTLGCGAKSGKYGAECRACYNDVEKARKQDTPGNRAIMCSTKMPVDVYDRRLTPVDESDPLLVARDLEVLQEDASSPSEEEHRQLTDDVPKWKAEEKWRNNTVPKWKQNQKWKTKKDDGVPKWRANQKWKKQYEDSPDEEGCLDGCEYTSKDGTKGRVCDSNCSRGDAYGTLGCGAKSGKYGAECRACYNDLEKARKQDTPGNRAIMCSTKMPVDVYGRRLTADDESDPLLVARDLEALQEDASSPSEEEEHRQLTEDVPKWKTQEKWKNNTVPKWKRNQKWKTKKDDGIPKWRANQKWKKQYEDSPDEEGCLDGCEYTSKDGTKGRVCDSNCSRGDAYGTLGCGAKSGKYGAECRACYNDVEKARKQDTPGNRAIMCSTREPVDVYGRRLSAHHEDYSLELAQLMGAEDSEDEDSEDGFEPRVEVEVGGREKAIRFFEAAAERTYLGEVQRGDLCAFVSGRVGDEAMWEVTVKSILQFMPGMKVAIAAEAEGLDAYERSMGRLPGVTVSGTQNPSTAALYADKYCSFSELILYVKPGSVLSRSFTPKDTHSPRGDLLVVHAGSQGSYHDTELSRRSSSVLGFEAPSFTQGTDLMLPGDANYYLREALGLKIGSEGLQGDGDGDAVIALQEFVDFDQVSAVPQVLAAVAYSRKTPGVWFVDPRGWVGQNLFKEASIWDIPLVKPRFTCTIAADKLDSASPKTAQVLQSSVDFFANGGKCANGLIAGAP